jgi:type III pantothenate kinase
VASIPYPDSGELLNDTVIELFRGKIPQKAAACSVSSRWREPLFKAIDDIIPGRLFVAKTAYDLNMKVQYDKPETYGVDRALAAYAAYREFRNACVVVDAGTAVTIDVITHNGMIAGGYIFPGCHGLAEILSVKTDLLSVYDCELYESIGTSTETCIRYGIAIGFGAAMNRLLAHALKTAGESARIVITGGGAEDLKKNLDFPFEYRPNLVLKALAQVIDIVPKYT